MVQEISTVNAERIALFLPSLGGGGAERVVLNLTHSFAERGLAVDLLLQRVEGPYLSQVPKEVRITDLKARRMMLALFPLISYLRREKPKSLLSAMTHTNIIAVLAKKFARVDTRVVISEHSTLGVSSDNATSLRGRYLPLLAKRIYPWADGIVAVSNGVADDLARTLGLPRERIEVIYNPVITPELLEKAKEPVEHRWFQPDEPPVILGVGRLTKAKDFPTLLRAFALVRKRHPCRLVILGEGEERSKLEALISELGISENVDMPGFVDNPYKYMARAEVFALSSIWEGLPTVLIEALACGTRIVSTDCPPSSPRKILGEGKYGTLVPVGDIEALANALLNTLTNKDNVLTPSPAAWLPFTPEAVIPSYIDVLRGSTCE